MNINSQLRIAHFTWNVSFLLHLYVNSVQKCLYHVIIVRPKVVPWYNEYDSWVFVLIKNQIGIHLQAMDVILLVDKMGFEI